MLLHDDLLFIQQHLRFVADLQADEVRYYTLSLQSFDSDVYAVRLKYHKAYHAQLLAILARLQAELPVRENLEKRAELLQ